MASDSKFTGTQGSDNTTRLGVVILDKFGVTPNRIWFWIGAAALLSLAFHFNILFTFALAYLNGKSHIAFKAKHEISSTVLHSTYN